MADYIPRGIREIVWKNKDKTRSTRYRIRIERADFQCDRSFELLDDAKDFLALTKTPEGRLSIANGTDPITTRQAAITEAIKEAIESVDVTLGQAIDSYIRVYIDPKLDSKLDKDKRSAKVSRDRLQHCKTIRVGWIKPGFAVPSGAFAKLKAQSKGYELREIGDFPIKDLTGQETTEYIRNRQKEGVKNSTIKREIGAMQSCVNKLMHTDSRAWKALDGYNPFKLADKSLLKGGTRRRRRVLNPDEENVLIRELKACRNPEMPIIFALGMHTGLRRAEILSLRWDQIDLEGGSIDLDPEQAKTGEERLIALSPEAIEALKTLKQKDERVFHLKIEGFKTNFQRVIKRSGLVNINFHDTRRSFVSRMLTELSTSSTFIAEKLGAKSVRSVEESLIRPLKKAAMIERGGPKTQEEVMWQTGHTNAQTQLGYTNIQGLKAGKTPAKKSDNR